MTRRRAAYYLGGLVGTNPGPTRSWRESPRPGSVETPKAIGAIHAKETRP